MRNPRLVLGSAALGLALVTGLAGCGSDDTGSTSGSTGGSTASADPTPSESGSPSASASEDSGDTLAVTVKGDTVKPSNQRIPVVMKDGLTVTVTSDRDGEIHVHSSPEQYLEFKAGTTTKKLTFDVPGVVEMEEHESGDLIAQLEVR